MQKGYFKAAWNDIKQSEGWFGKMFLLGLLSLIPIFGQVVLFGYAYGWLRDIAWGVETPLPPRIFGNEDGQLYRRGLIVFVINTVFCLIAPGVVEGVFSVMAGRGLDTVSGAVFGGTGHVLSGNISGLFSLLILVIASLFYLVAAARASIYGRLGPGFQLSRLWAMMRHDTKGLVRVVCVGVVLTVCMGANHWRFRSGNGRRGGGVDGVRRVGKRRHGKCAGGDAVRVGGHAGMPGGACGAFGGFRVYHHHDRACHGILGAAI